MSVANVVLLLLLCVLLTVIFSYDSPPPHLIVQNDHVTGCSKVHGLWCDLTFLFLFYFYVFSRARRPAEVCAAVPDLHQQGQGCPPGPLSAGPLPGHGGSDRTGGWAVSGMYWVGQDREEDLPQTSTWGDETWWRDLAAEVICTSMSSLILMVSEYCWGLVLHTGDKGLITLM